MEKFIRVTAGVHEGRVAQALAFGRFNVFGHMVEGARVTFVRGSHTYVIPTGEFVECDAPAVAPVDARFVAVEVKGL